VATLRLREATRAVLLDDDDRIMLVKYIFPSGARRWGTPGGGLDPGESHLDGLARELREELGLVDVPIGPHIWDRVHVFPMRSGEDGQRDRFFLVRVPHFDPVPEIGWERMRAEFVHDARWWTLDEVERSTVLFAPAALGVHLRRLLQEGPPERPIDVGA
jgi:8-oxo-dGTP pyrophosphatase MutT (NUDIX family)